MPKLYKQESNELLGTISQEDVALLIAQLEEESEDDQDYYLNRDTLSILADAGISKAFLALVEPALDAEGEGDFRWEAD